MNKLIFLLTLLIILIIFPSLIIGLPIGNYYFKSAGCQPCIKQDIIIKKLEKQDFNIKIYGPNDREEFKDQKIRVLPTIIIIKKNETIRLEGIQSFQKLIELMVK